MSDELLVAKALMAAGSLACAKSIEMTFRHSARESFEAAGYRLGRKHTRYHAFRGGTLAVGAVAALNLTGALWNIAAVVAACYFGGWWAPKPFLGLKTPSWMAEGVHIAAAVLCSAALLLARPAFFN
eukprot:gene13156-5971_t